jgi:hypothetical protein
MSAFFRDEADALLLFGDDEAGSHPFLSAHAESASASPAQRRSASADDAEDGSEGVSLASSSGSYTSSISGSLAKATASASANSSLSTPDDTQTELHSALVRSLMLRVKQLEVSDPRRSPTPHTSQLLA